MKIAGFKLVNASSPIWVTSSSPDDETSLTLPRHKDFGDGILLSKAFKDAGINIGDRGTISYFIPTLSSIQEQALPVFVSGFYDPGIIPIGGKFLFVNPSLTSMIKQNSSQEDNFCLNGINITMNQAKDADLVKSQLEDLLKEQGLRKYWKIETYKDFEFTKDLFMQLQSERNLFTLIALIIIIVACSNIISMLIILVNDKRLEIGILRSMGASSFNIGMIFGLSGLFMGMLGSLIGTLASIVTLKYLDLLLQMISRWQGYELLNRSIYGDTLPHELSVTALQFVLFATIILSLIAGIIPAIKACLLKPSEILKSE